MNESEFENQLRALTPTSPSRALERVIEQELAHACITSSHERPKVSGVGRWDAFLSRLIPGLGWAFGGAAVAVAILTFAHPRQADRIPANALITMSSTGAFSPEFEPAESARHVVAAQESDVMYTPDSEPARVVRYTSVERHVWQNPTTGARIEVEAPREDVMLLPVSFQ